MAPWLIPDNIKFCHQNIKVWHFKAVSSKSDQYQKQHDCKMTHVTTDSNCNFLEQDNFHTFLWNNDTDTLGGSFGQFLF